MPLIRHKHIIVWSSVNFDNACPFGRLCTRCKKKHEELTKFCNKCKTYCNYFYEKNKKNILSNQKTKRSLDIDKYREQERDFYERNKQKIRTKQNNKNALDPESNRVRVNTYQNTRRGKMLMIRRKAKERNIDMIMSDVEIKNMTDLPCVYCGHETEDKVCRNGIDRLDSFIGYTISNCVPCCGTCNLSKGQVDPITFIERAKQISLNNEGVGEITSNWTFVKSQSFVMYKNMIMKNGKHFELTKEEFEVLRSTDCKYCGRSSSEEHSNGIDQVDPKGGYIISNCVPCCRDCNFMKNTMNVDDFITLMKKIATCTYVFPDIPRMITTFSTKL